MSTTRQGRGARLARLSTSKVFEKHIGMAYAVSRKILTREDGSRPTEDDIQDLVGDAYAHMGTVRGKHPELKPPQWVAYAVRRAGWARLRQLARRSRKNASDTPLMVSMGEDNNLEHLADVPRYSSWGTEFIDSLPVEKREIATALALTDNQQDARKLYSALRGAHCSECTWDAHVRSLRGALEDALPEYAQARAMGDADFADAVPVPPRPMGRPAPEPIRGIPMQYEHELALHNLLNNPQSVAQFVAKLAGWTGGVSSAERAPAPAPVVEVVERTAVLLTPCPLDREHVESTPVLHRWLSTVHPHG